MITAAMRQLSLFRKAHRSYQHSTLNTSFQVTAIHLVESDRDQFLKEFTEYERSSIVYWTYQFFLEHSESVHPDAEYSRRKAIRFLLIKTETQVPKDKLKHAIRRIHHFKHYLYYHYLIHLHRTHAIPFLNYGAYYNRSLTARHWANLRRYVFRKQKYICAARNCFSRPQELHHLVFISIGRETPDQVLGYCRKCHLMQHGKKPKEHIQLEFELPAA